MKNLFLFFAIIITTVFFRRQLAIALTFLVTVGLISLVFGADPYEIDRGVWTCPRGYFIKQGRCYEIGKSPDNFEMSKVLPGNGSYQERSCPSGGCNYISASPAPSVIESYSITGDQGNIGRAATGVMRHSVTIIK
jgi:hypothetical protein